MYDESLKALNARGVTIEDIVECTYFLQKNYLKDLNKKDIYDCVIAILKKREVQNVVLTGINFDIACEKRILDSKNLEQIILNDSSLYGVDEVLAYGICNLYGSIALTNFGYIDRVKPGIIGELNAEHKSICNTFLDDIVGAIAASAASLLAHGD